MNKKLVPVIIVIVLLLLGGGAYVMMHKSAAPASMTAANPTETAAPAGQTGTLKSLLTAGTQTCTFTSDKGASGTVYVSGGKMRGDFSSTTQGQTVNGHMILDSGYSYIWTDTMKQGFKVALPTGTPTGTPNNQAMDINQNVTYSCKPWVADASKFTLPADITFGTLTIPNAAAPTTAGTSGTGVQAPSSACAACANIPAGPAQTACKTQLHCE